jgi:hypothetical protein
MNPNRDLAIDTAKFDLLWPLAYPYYSKIPLITKFIKKLVKDDVLQFGQLFEKAIEVQCNLIRESTYGQDFKNGDDAKCIVVRTYNYNKSYAAPVTNIHSKQGWLLVSVYERKQNNWYFFRIPHEAYKNIPKTSNIDIPFELDGTPRKHPKKFGVYNWWQHEVKSFKLLAGE